jgi:hypothetical protein
MGNFVTVGPQFEARGRAWAGLSGFLTIIASPSAAEVVARAAAAHGRRRELPETKAMEHSRNPTRGTDRVLRFAPTAPTRHSPEETAKHAGQSALDLIHQVAIVITSNEARAEAIVQRAIDELKAAEERIKGLEARALSAEARANEAEKWLVRLHDAIQEKIADGRIDDARLAPARPLVA